ncbi:MAG: hypothetical protein JSW23_04935 [Planctomycetota bacterium]|nr:MAG: hypothetical protein JSW23_04935 [Planctomycetota bacterium]
MFRRRKQTESDEAPGAPEWMVTFSDCMTLLLTFFVLLLSFSCFEKHIFTKLRIIFCKALPGVSAPTDKDRDALLEPPSQVIPTPDIDAGSEKPTYTNGWKENLMQETEPPDFHSRRVFVIPSENVFWGKGTAISFVGRRTLNSMASFLKELPARIVISENGPEDRQDSDNFGLPRAWAVLDYFVTKHDLDRDQFSISAATTLAPDDLEAEETEPERKIEIVLLERSIYN